MKKALFQKKHPSHHIFLTDKHTSEFSELKTEVGLT